MPSEIIDNDIGYFRGTEGKLRRHINYSVATSFVTYLIEKSLAGTEQERINKYLSFLKKGDFTEAAHL